MRFVERGKPHERCRRRRPPLGKAGKGGRAAGCLPRLPGPHQSAMLEWQVAGGPLRRGRRVGLSRGPLIALQALPLGHGWLGWAAWALQDLPRLHLTVPTAGASPSTSRWRPQCDLSTDRDPGQSALDSRQQPMPATASMGGRSGSRHAPFERSPVACLPCCLGATCFYTSLHAYMGSVSNCTSHACPCLCGSQVEIVGGDGRHPVCKALFAGQVAHQLVDGSQVGDDGLLKEGGTGGQSGVENRCGIRPGGQYGQGGGARELRFMAAGMASC